MKEIQIMTTITVKENGDILTDIIQKTGVPDDDNKAAAGVLFEKKTEVEELETEREAIVSDLANVCEYLEECEVIKIRLIVNKAQMRKERIERESEV